MKKLISLLVALMLVIALLPGCASQKAETTQPETTAQETTEEAAKQETTEEAAQPETSEEAPADGIVTTKGTWEVKDKPLVGLSFKTLQEQRWVDELDLVTELFEAEGCEVIYQIADNDVQKQLDQIDNLITKGVDILVCVAVDPNTIANSMQKAHEAGALVSYYECVQDSFYCDILGGLDNIAVGAGMTSAIADALPDGGKVGLIGGSTSGSRLIREFKEGMSSSFTDPKFEVVGFQDVEKYDAAQAQAIAENWITQYGDEIKAICPMNDGMAGGVIKALEAAGLAGKVLVGGQDADILACQRIAAGTQYSTVYKNSKAAATKLVECTMKLYRGELTEADFGGKYGTNLDGDKVPFAAVDPVVVTAENLDEVLIDGGVYTHEEIYGK